MLTTKQIVIRLLVSALLGSMIGIEREVHNRPAGIRTHILVTLGSTLIMMISTDALLATGSATRFDPGRMAAQVISGIGFLGAGTILKMGNTIVGLTTAASLWVSAGIGLAIGVGYYLPGILVSIIVVVTLIYFRALDKYTIMGKQKTISVLMDQSCAGISSVEDFLINLKVVVVGIEILGDGIKELELRPGEIAALTRVVFKVRLPRDIDYDEFYHGIYGLPGISGIKIEKNI